MFEYSSGMLALRIALMFVPPAVSPRQTVEMPTGRVPLGDTGVHSLDVKCRVNAFVARYFICK